MNRFADKYRYVFLIIGSIAFLYLILRYGLGNLAHDIAKTGIWFIPVILLWLIIYLLNTYNWFVNIKALDEHIGFWELLNNHICSSAINYITPFVSLGGEPYRLIYAAERMGKEKAISSVILYNIFHVFSHILFWTGCCIVIITTFKDGYLISLSWAALIVFSLIILLLLAGLRKGFFAFFIRKLEGRLFIKPLNRFLRDKKEKILRIDSLICSIHSRKKRYFYAAILSEFVSRIVASIEFYIILYSIDIYIPLFTAIYIYGAASLLLNILSFVPMESGTREGALYYISDSIGINAETGIYISVVTRIREFFWIFTGIFLMKFYQFNKRDCKTDFYE